MLVSSCPLCRLPPAFERDAPIVLQLNVDTRAGHRAVLQVYQVSRRNSPRNSSTRIAARENTVKWETWYGTTRALWLSTLAPHKLVSFVSSST